MSLRRSQEECRLVSPPDLNVDAVVRTLAVQIAPLGGRALRLTGEDEPAFVVLHPDVGLVAVDISHAPYDPADQTPFTELNTKVHALRRTLGLDAATSVGRVVLHGRASLPELTVGPGGRTSISPAQLRDSGWLRVVPTEVLDEETRADITARLFPELVFTTTFRSDSRDKGADERAALRVVLDAQQAMIAQRDDIQLAQLRGPPGSGKTLVLAARARWLAERNPSWRIRLLCYNNALLPYLRSLTVGYANISASLFTGFAAELGVRFSFEDDSVTYQGLAAARARGIRPIADAILIDEVQDFRAPWLVIAYEGLVRGRGGLLMAGDNAQALYQESEPPGFLREKGIEELALDRPYRSTRNILQALGALDESFAVAAEESPDGEPVELIWAPSWDEQAKAIAWEVHLMLSSGDRRPGDIGILITTWYGTHKRLQAELPKYDILFTVIDKENQADFDRAEDTVKVMTVHKAKGHEFPVVVLFGLETLPAFDPTDAKSRQRARVGFVGFTRAMDQLLITYTRDNAYLKILSKDEKHVRRWLWPDSYEGVSLSDG